MEIGGWISVETSSQIDTGTRVKSVCLLDEASLSRLKIDHGVEEVSIRYRVQ